MSRRARKKQQTLTIPSKGESLNKLEEALTERELALLAKAVENPLLKKLALAQLEQRIDL